MNVKTLSLTELVVQGEYEEIRNRMQFLFAKIVKNMVLKNNKILFELFSYVNSYSSFFNGLEPQFKNEDTNKLVVQLDEYAFILQTYFKENIDLEILENLADYRYSFNVLEELKYRKLTLTELHEDILPKEPEADELALLDNTVAYLKHLNLIDINEDSYFLANRGKNIFEIYTASKKFTNKYEKLKRNQVTTPKVKVDIELLEKIENVKHAFKVLEVFYDYSNAEFTIDTLLDELFIERDELEFVLAKLEEFLLIASSKDEEDEDADTYYKILNAGRNVFKVYRTSKKYTNKYEKIKRKEKKF